ncbi:LysM peptidoglycan-binding domain-containing protein [Subtercola boreus]|uniref:LysM domain-containing protein n=1 Tax=Subtercola boreus TaxID=120213 RepID=A0A3E0WDL9_9MICO|nr:LysM peptidoglycan-binding domain-containing protein [Subtercola boreus]RFA21835.1 hypothetical protein B7R24_06020 [Subtercola boreus]RFA21946.1 hypothetical protein B7R23_05965 [Subtercola boreus]RFA27894.1 hypothetical protein B7R25_06090 [Subtercola boreus]
MTAVHLIGTPRTEARRPRLHLTRRGRAVVGAIASLPLAAALVAFAIFGGSAAVATSSAQQADFSYVTVHSGESLWSIASGLSSSADTRDVIADIVNLNQLPTSEVQPGQRLAIPTKYEK